MAGKFNMITIFGKTSGKINEPIFLADASDMQKMDADCVKRQKISFADLMEKAAKAVFDCIVRRNFNAAKAKVAILCGPGNNGGDGHILGRLFAEASSGVRIINVFGEVLSDIKLQEMLIGKFFILYLMWIVRWCISQ